MCRLARGIHALFRNDVDAVMVAAPEPPLRLVRDPECPFDHAGMALGIPRHGLQLYIPGPVQGHLAVQPPLRIALALAERAQRLRLDVAVIDVETAHDPLAAAVDGFHPGRQRQWHAGPGLAIRPQRQQLHGQRLADRHPALGPHADLHGGRPALYTTTQGLDLAVRIGIAGFHRQRLRTVGGGQRQCQQTMALRIQHERKPVGHQAILRTTGCLPGVRVLSGVLIVLL